MLTHRSLHLFYPSLYLNYLGILIGDSARNYRGSKSKKVVISEISSLNSRNVTDNSNININKEYKDSKAYEVKEEQEIISPMIELGELRYMYIGILFLISLCIGVSLDLISHAYCPSEGILDLVIINSLLLLITYDD